MSESPAPGVATSPWVLSPVRDLLLFVGTPLLILPLALLVLGLGVASREIQYFVLAFGAMGHNLPGMIRAYGDRALFRRFRWRFILAPVIFFGLCLGFAMRGSQAILLVAFFWSVWHALMQVYGFMRIYDAKAGAVDRKTAKLDLALCIAWFGSAALFSDTRLFYIQDMLAGFGVPPLAPAGLDVVRIVAVVGLAAITFAHLWHRMARGRAGHAVNPVKDLLIVSTIGFWWGAHVLTDDVLLGLILFEVFHDVQYLAIVWIFNRRRVETDPGVGSFTRFVFRRSWGMMGIYIGLVLAYGGFVPLTQGLKAPQDTVMIFAVLIQTSALLHYYFDGFIWKVREESTRSALGIADGSGSRELRVPAHALKWLVLFVPSGVMAFAGEVEPSVEHARALVASTPNASRAHLRLGEALNAAKRHIESLPALERCIALDPGDLEAQTNLAYARLEAGKQELRAGRIARASHYLGLARASIPSLVDACNNEGLELWKRKNLAAAAIELRAALIMDPKKAEAHLNLALVYRQLGERGRALRHARQGAALRPADRGAQHLVRTLEGR